MKILVIGKYPPIQGGVSTDTFWTSQMFAEMGHEVRVLTSANEVEEEYRMALSEEDKTRLNGFRKSGSIRVHSTHIDTMHKYVPKGNPVVSKLVSTGLEIIEEFRPDFLWSFYLEPFGVAALFLHLLTGVPYTVRHAGTDFGRLFLSTQLERLYKEVFKRALLVFSKKKHHHTMFQIGVSPDRLMEPVSPRLPGDIFYPELMPDMSNGLRLGVYGKVGPAKGTEQLIRALAQLRDEKFPVSLTAYWGGRGIEKYLQLVQGLSLKEPYLTIRSFIPQWRIADFIRSVHAVAFLENRFHIDFHAPGVPFEVNSCGRFLITTTEIAEKSRLVGIIEDPITACIVSANPLRTEEVVSAIKRVSKMIANGVEIPAERIFDASFFSVCAYVKITEHLGEIAKRI